MGTRKERNTIFFYIYTLKIVKSLFESQFNRKIRKNKNGALMITGYVRHLYLQVVVYDPNVSIKT
jgi:hypothetical protein